MNHQTRALLVLPRVATQRDRSRHPSNKRHRAAPCRRRARRGLLLAAKSPRRPPEAAGSLKPGTDEPPNEGAARAASGRHAARPKPPPLKQTPQGYSMPPSRASTPPASPSCPARHRRDLGGSCCGLSRDRPHAHVARMAHAVELAQGRGHLRVDAKGLRVTPRDDRGGQK
jgi:hypothetical protein